MNERFLPTTKYAMRTLELLEKTASFSDQVMIDQVRRQLVHMEDVRQMQMGYIDLLSRWLELCRSGKEP